MYPNPASHELTFSVRSPGAISVVLVDMFGRKVVVKLFEHGSVQTIDVTHLAAGNYAFVVYAEGGYAYQSIVVR